MASLDIANKDESNSHQHSGLFWSVERLVEKGQTVNFHIGSVVGGTLTIEKDWSFIQGRLISKE